MRPTARRASAVGRRAIKIGRFPSRGEGLQRPYAAAARIARTSSSALGSLRSAYACAAISCSSDSFTAEAYRVDLRVSAKNAAAPTKVKAPAAPAAPPPSAADRALTAFCQALYGSAEFLFRQ